MSVFLAVMPYVVFGMFGFMVALWVLFFIAAFGDELPLP